MELGGSKLRDFAHVSAASALSFASVNRPFQRGLGRRATWIQGNLLRDAELELQWEKL